jgi:hypothetical protein
MITNIKTTVKKDKSYTLTQKIAVTLAVATAVIIAGLTVAAVRERQDIRQQAQSADVVQFTLIPASTQIKPGQAVVVDLEINTRAKSVSGFTVQGSVQGIASNRISISPTQVTNLISNVDWIKDTNNGAAFSITYLSNPETASIFTTQGRQTKIASLILNPTETGNVTVSIQSSPSTTVFEYAKGFTDTAIGYVQSFTVGITDTLPTPSPDSRPDRKKSCDENCATDTECSSEFVCYKGRCRAPSDREDPRCAVPEVAGLNRSCNEYCADSRECNSKFTCYYNRCRLAENIDSTSCEAPARPAVTQATPRTGVGGSGQTTQPAQTTTTTTRPATTQQATTQQATPAATTTPRTITTTVTVTPTATVSVQLATPSSQVATSAAIPSSPFPSPQTIRDTNPVVASPEIVPLPDNLTPDALAAQQSSNNTTRIILIILSSVGIIGLIGFGIYYWRKN